jgi:hypothetical protein
MSLLIPRPIRDIVTGPFIIRSAAQEMQGFKAGSAQAAVIGIFGGGKLTLPPAENMIKGALRISLAVVGAMFLSGSSFTVALVIGAIVSLPTAAIVGGSALYISGVTAAQVALATGSFFTLGSSILLLASGYILLECHDIIPLGLAEGTIRSIAGQNSKQLASSFISDLRPQR